MKKIAVIGSGISGIVSAYLLSRKYDVTLLEAADRLGGHTHTVPVKTAGDDPVGIDTGFIVFNLKNYPLFTQFLNQLNVPFQDSDMSFGYYDAAQSYWYCSDVPNGLFSQKRNLVSGTHWQLMWDIHRFNTQVLSDLSHDNFGAQTLEDYIQAKAFRPFLVHRYLLPMGAAIWSCPVSDILQFPAKAFFSFWQNHSLLSLGSRPVWKTVTGGSTRYIKAFLSQFTGQVQKNTAAQAVVRQDNRVRVLFSDGRPLDVDYAVLATHADTSLQILSDPTPLEQSLLGAWTYSKNTVFLHTDRRVMPPKRSGWASWLVQRPGTPSAPLHMTYYMNRLQRLDTDTDYFVTLNQNSLIAPEKCLRTIEYTHPVYTPESVTTQPQLAQLNTGPIFFCGSYFGYGFHEDGVRSAVNVCQKLGVQL